MDAVAGSQAGDRHAQRRLYDEFHERIFRLAVRMVGRCDAPDVLQQVFLQVFRNIHRFSGKSSFATWLYRLAVNECLQFRRRERRSGANGSKANRSIRRHDKQCNLSGKNFSSGACRSSIPS